MSEVAELRRRVQQMERAKPDLLADPMGHRRVNDEITRICDEIRDIQKQNHVRKGIV